MSVVSLPSARLRGERRPQGGAVDEHDDAEQEQSTDALFDLHPQWEEAGERDDDDDSHEHNGCFEPQSDIPTTGTSGHPGGKKDREQSAGNNNGSTDPDGWSHECGVVVQQDDGYESENAEVEVAANEQLYVAQRRLTSRLIQAFFGDDAGSHDMIPSLEH
jgi:hypothetical protein